MMNIATVSVSAGRLFSTLILISLITVSCETTPQKPRPDQASTIRNMGEAYIMQGDYTAALKELLKAEKINPNDPVTHNYLGIVYKNKHLTDRAIGHFQKAVDLNPAYSQARNNLGTAYLEKKDWDAAIICFKDVISDMLYATPNYPLSNLGWAYYNKKEYPLAETYYKKALQIQPNLLVAISGLGQTYMAMGKYSEAVETFKNSVKYGHRVPQFHLQLARAYELSKDYDNALRAYSIVIELDPGSDLAKEAAGAKDRINRLTESLKEK